MSLKIENVKKEHLKVLQLTERREGKQAASAQSSADGQRERV